MDENIDTNTNKDNGTVNEAFEESELVMVPQKSYGIQDHTQKTLQDQQQPPVSSIQQSFDTAEIAGGDDTRRKKKKRFPYCVFLIILNEFCERLSYYGLRTVLILYFTQFLRMNDNNATGLYHTFSMLCYFTPLLGAILADGYIGLFKTIVWVSLVYALGDLILCLTSIIPLGAPNIPGPVIGLLLIAFGTGGIKPCVSAFGGNQFSSEQTKYLDTYFALFYFSINTGSLIGTILTPVLRSDVKCFNNDCYPLAFGIPTILMFLSIVIIVAGKRFYTIEKVNKEENIFKNVFHCITYAIRERIRHKKTADTVAASSNKSHWLDHAEGKYSREFVNDVKAFVRVIIVFLPLPIFWALYDQQGSRWTLQVNRMNTNISDSFSLKTDQIQSINPILILILIPIFNWIVYPVLDKFKILTKPLQRMTVGMIFACVAFVVAAILEFHIQSIYLKVNSNNIIKFMNLSPCDIDINSENLEFNLHVSAYDRQNISYNSLVEKNIQNETFEVRCSSGPISLGTGLPVTQFSIKPNQQLSTNSYVFFYSNSNTNNTVGTLKVVRVKSSLENEPIGNSQARLYTLTSMYQSKYDITITSKELNIINPFPINTIIPTANYDIIISNSSNYKDVTSDLYDMKVVETLTNKTGTRRYMFNRGARYTYFLFDKEDGLGIRRIVEIQENQVTFAYQLVQYVLITIGEIMFSINGLAFAYSQAPKTMKSILQASWLLTVAFGNLIVVIVAESSFIKNQAYEYLLFAGLMGITTVVFAIMSYFYVYKDDKSNNDAQMTTPIGGDGQATIEDKEESNKERVALSNIQLTNFNSINQN